MMIRRNFSIAILVGAMCFVSNIAFGQAPPPSSNPPGAPIDGIVAVLLAAGVGYGVYRSKRDVQL
jgi:purine-cytosine permease-like protein